MQKINQTIVDIENGDCTRACLASLLELPIDAIPNFIRFKNKWFFMMRDFLRRLGYDYIGTGSPNGRSLKESPNINGYIMASVPSKTFSSGGHSVIIDLDGNVVHDPNPNKLWENINVLETKELTSWALIEPMSEHTKEYTPVTFSINHYDSDGDMIEEGIFLYFEKTSIKVAKDKTGLAIFGKQIQDIIKEIQDNY